MFIVSAHSRFTPIDTEKARIRIAIACRMTFPKKMRMIGGKVSRPSFATDLQRPRHFPILNDTHHVRQRPKLRRDPGRHCRRYPQALVDTDEVVMHEVDRD